MARLALTAEQVDAGREEICQASMRVFARGGIEAVTLRAIAKELAWSCATPYRYFANKDEIIVALRTATFARFADVLEAAIAVETDPAASLAALIRAYTEAALADPDGYRLLLDMRQEDSNAFPELARQRRRAFETCVRTARAARAAGLIPADSDAETVAHVFWSGVHGLLSLHLADQLVMTRTLDDLIEPLTQTLVAGMLARRGEPSAN